MVSHGKYLRQTQIINKLIKLALSCHIHMIYYRIAVNEYCYMPTPPYPPPFRPLAYTFQTDILN